MLATYDPLQNDKAYGNSASVLADLIARTSHSHLLYKTDSATVFGDNREATRGSVYATTIKLFARKRD